MKKLVVLFVVLVMVALLATPAFAQGNSVVSPQQEAGHTTATPNNGGTVQSTPTAPQNGNGVGEGGENGHGPCPTPAVVREGEPQGNGEANGPKRDGPHGPNCPNCPVVTPTPMPNDSIVEPVIPPMDSGPVGSVTPTLPITVEVPVTTTVEVPAPTIYRVFLPIMAKQGSEAPTTSDEVLVLRTITTTYTTTTTFHGVLEIITTTTTYTTTTTTQQQADGPDLWVLALLGGMCLPLLGFTHSRKRIWIVVLVLVVLTVAIVPNASASNGGVYFKAKHWSGWSKLYKADGSRSGWTYGRGWYDDSDCHQAKGKYLCRLSPAYRSSSKFVALSGTAYAVQAVR